jgi:hypothetical protein
MNPFAVIGPGIAGQKETQVSATDVLPTTENLLPKDSLCYLNVDAPMPYLRCGTPVKHFQALRQAVINGAGFDFLAKCGDMMRARNARPTKIGVAFNSRHKDGEAFDYNQEDNRVLLVREYDAGHLYWRTYLRCEMQDGTQGFKADLSTDNSGLVSAYVFDFTAAAEKLGWERIPAQSGWAYEPSNKEFWHYQLREDLSFDQAITQSTSTPPTEIRAVPNGSRLR